VYVSYIPGDITDILRADMVETRGYTLEEIAFAFDERNSSLGSVATAQTLEMGMGTDNLGNKLGDEDVGRK
jgi:hypothetical protein